MASDAGPSRRRSGEFDEPGNGADAERNTERLPPVQPDDEPAGGRRFVATARVEEFPDIPAEELAGLRGTPTPPPLGPVRVLPLEEEPSALVSQYLFPTERYRGEWKRHWIHLVPQLAIGTAATFALGYVAGFLARYTVSGLTTVAILVWLGVMGWVGWQVADWFYDRFILTNKRVMVVAGLITRRVAMMPLLRVTDMKYEQSPMGRLFNYGTFVLESAGQEQALREVKHLPNPNELYLRVVEEMYEPQAVEARLSQTPDDVKADDGS